MGLRVVATQLDAIEICRVRAQHFALLVPAPILGSMLLAASGVIVDVNTLN